jgi:hypothetical protein
VLGGYFWGGYTGANALVEGARKLSEAGLSKHIRVVASPRMRTGATGDNIYNFNLTTFASTCPASQPFLPCFVRTQEFQNFLALPGFPTIIVTAFDSASTGANGTGFDYVNPTSLASADLRAKVVAEYRDMTLALYEMQRGTGRTFIISNWESDNAIYCGEAFSYLTSSSFRSSCDAQSPTPSQKILGLTEWFKLRQQGINEGKTIAAQNGWNGVTVVDGIQFNSYLRLENAGFSNVLHDVIPTVRPAYADYSAWESSEQNTTESDIVGIKAKVAQYGATLMIGELGVLGINTSSANVTRLLETITAAQRANPALITLWEAYPATTFGDALFNADGSWTSAFNTLRSALLNGTLPRN